MSSRARVLFGGSLILGALLAAVWSMGRSADEPAATAGEALGEPYDPPALAAAPPIRADDLDPWVRQDGWGSPGALSISDADSRERIAGAAITLLTDEAESELGSTDEKGVWPGPWPDSPPPWRLRITADGYLTAEAVCDRETRWLQMTAEGEIHGSVVGAPQAALTAGLIEVLAWDTSGEAYEVAQRPGERPISHRKRAVVRSDGSFMLPGLRRGRPHTLIATGPSFGSAQAAEKVPADGRSVTLEGMLLYGALVRVTGPNGASLLGGPDVRQTDPVSQTRLLAKHPRHPLAGDAYLRWLGLDPPVANDESNERTILVYLPEGDSPDVELTVARPGYETWSRVVSLPPATQPLQEIAVVLQPWTLEFGSVELAIHGMGSIGLRQTPHDGTADAELHFVATALRGAQEGRSLALAATIPDLAKHPLVVGPLPAGDYTLVLRGGFAHRTPQEHDEDPLVRIRADRIASVDFDLSMLGVFDVSLVTSRDAYYGPAQVRLSSQHGSRIWSFSGTPHRIPMLPPGEYEVGLVGDVAMPDAESAMQKISVSAGRVARLLLRVNR